MSVAKYPVDAGDTEGITDAVNYLLSGPSGLGQNFQGFAAYLPAYLRPSSKQPWSLPIDTGLNPSIYLDIPINNAFPCDETGTPWAATSAYIRLDFVTPQATAPFQFGDKLDINNVVDTGGGNPPYSYNDSGYLVFSSTTTYVILTFDFVEYEWSTYISGGDVGRDYMNYELDTDCNSRVTVEGATTQVFISAQLNLAWDIVVNTPNAYNVKVQIKRFRGFPSQTAGSPEFLFADGVLVSEKVFVRPGTTSGAEALEAIFTTVLDKPSFGYYWYILDVYFDMPTSVAPHDVEIGKVTTGLRSLTAQVIKQ